MNLAGPGICLVVCILFKNNHRGCPETSDHSVRFALRGCKHHAPQFRGPTHVRSRSLGWIHPGREGVGRFGASVWSRIESDGLGWLGWPPNPGRSSRSRSFPKDHVRYKYVGLAWSCRYRGQVRLCESVMAVLNPYMLAVHCTQSGRKP